MTASIPTIKVTSVMQRYPTPVWFRVKNIAAGKEFPDLHRFTEFDLSQIVRIEDPLKQENLNASGMILFKNGDYVHISPEDWPVFMEAFNAFRIERGIIRGGYPE